MSGASPEKMEFGSYESKHSLTAIVCNVLRFGDMETSVGGIPSLMLIIFPLPLSKMVDFIVLGQRAWLVNSSRGCVGSLAFWLSCDA